MDKPVDLAYFSDILCVWAYISQIRLDELKLNLGDKVCIHQHFISVFGCTEQRIGEGWADRGGFDGFSDNVCQVGKQFPHISVNPDIWKRCRPKTSCTSHIFLKAAQLLEARRLVSPELDPLYNRTLVEELIWRVRRAFFEEAKDVGRLSVLYTIAEQLKFPLPDLEALINDGSAMAALQRDMELKDMQKLEGSPSYLLNDGRQKLYGNVGYRVIEANVVELLEHPDLQASWC
jgi:predicted DsbA family dithiol-disulfide isomerase